MPKQITPEAGALADKKDEPWTEAELTAAVLAYLAMQQKHAQGEKFIKKQVYRELAAQFPRSEKAFEFRMQNISYVLQEMGRGWLQGLKPAENVGPTNSAIIQRIILAGYAEPAPVRKENAEQENALYKVNLIPVGVVNPKKEEVSVTQIARDPKVKNWILANANGHCECCRQPAPFNKSEDGQPFLETHHLVLLAAGGPDTLQNAVALCPNCHRELHFGANRAKLREQLYVTISRLKPA